MNGLISFVLAACMSLEPTQRAAYFAGVVSSVLEEEAPLFANDDDRHKTAAVLVALGWFESGFRFDAVGDGGESVCAFQIYRGSRELLTNHAECVRVALRHLRSSVAQCKDSPLAIYARGKCESAEGRKLGGHRMALAKRLISEVR